ncbi:putative neutral zinc metallopeptidase [Thioploca ingrica]|uniref:Putative neutral zinc metallopeptidase n=1 Tax=Thioploca ingrica TaxID=40754 RepID=A0A090AQE8_9GAMM|nr:putative neutral zinc metallopeptidase [Thioploca ingrica]
MYILILLFFIIIIFGPQLWARQILTHYSQSRDDFPGTGGELARHLLDRLNLSAVQVQLTELGDHYDPIQKVVRLSRENWEGKSLTAVVTAAHEVGHAIQDHIGYQPLQQRTQLVEIAQSAEKLGAGLMVMIPVVALVIRIPAASVLMFLGGFASLGTAALVHLITLPVEWDASFRRALPLLAKGQYIAVKDQRAARLILTACALTYASASLASLLNLWRWLAILKR